MALRGALPVALLLLVASAAMGAVSVQQTLVTVPEANAPPVTLAQSSHGTTVVGPGATSATTTVAFPAITLLPRNVLAVQHVSGDWLVRLEAQSASGFGALETVSLTLIGATTQLQLTVSAGNVIDPVTGIPVLLDAADPLITVQATTLLVAPTGTVDMHVVMVPAAGDQPEVRYPFKLVLT